MFEKFLQTLMDATAVGSLYALIALGYTMVYGILKFINFAHSDVFVLGAWLSLTAAVHAGWSATTDPQPIGVWVWVIVMGLSVAAAGGVVVERLTWPKNSGRFRLSETRQAGVLTLMAVWAWAVLGLFGLAAWMKPATGSPLASGMVILVFACAACGLVGFTIERLAYKPLRKAPRLNVLITAIGVSLFLQNLGQLDAMFGTRPAGMPQLIEDRVLLEFGGARNEAGGWAVNPVPLRLVDVLGAGTAVMLMLALDRLVFHSKVGRAMRAVSYNPANAALMGIPVDRVISITFVIGTVLAAAAGFLYGQKYPTLNQTAAPLWVLLGLKAFVAAVIGGIGNIRGAMLGGLLIALLEFFVAAYVPNGSQLKEIFVFGLLIAVLLVRPSGLLGKATTEKV